MSVQMDTLYRTLGHEIPELPTTIDATPPKGVMSPLAKYDQASSWIPNIEWADLKDKPDHQLYPHFQQFGRPHPDTKQGLRVSNICKMLSAAPSDQLLFGDILECLYRGAIVRGLPVITTELIASKVSALNCCAY